ncbi:MAG: thioredoxin domain-containing protein [Myxococcales bacterium]|nr:thioredoxin domain-containing protein [Myxococcales bacterium]
MQHGEPTSRRPTNRLGEEKSPYLLQHAHNPVDWYPWCDEAFEKARREDKPIFLSIGYSTCHWCHVMERESFEDREVARLLNERFLCVKVDREERPEIDAIYMTACQLATGGGGWPLTIVMTPDGQPFFAGTYFPKTGRFGRPGMLELLPKLDEHWVKRRNELLESAGEFTEALMRHTTVAPGEAPDLSICDAGYAQLSDRFDPRHGGLSGRMKFPTPHNYTFLLRYHARTGQAQARRIVEKTLDAMRAGGIYDHIGFGFHRYATDAEWLVPHFEKMLYDQAQLLILYTEAWQLLGKSEYEQTAREIADYVRRVLTDEGGAFYSAEDADSEGVEGKFYLWNEAELHELFDEGDAGFVAALFGFEPDGNFRDEATGRKTSDNIPFLPHSIGSFAAAHGFSTSDVRQRWEKLRSRLFAVREERVHPYKDDKILTDWNGLMIGALARAGRAFGDATMLQAARRASDFIFSELFRDGRLLHRYRDGDAALQATIGDYAFMAFASLELFLSGGVEEDLARALSLVHTAYDHFGDRVNGGFFTTANDHERLILRQKEIYDGAIPSGNAILAETMLRLSRICGDGELERRARDTLVAFSDAIRRLPLGHTVSLQAIEEAYGRAIEIVVVGDPGDPATRALYREVERRFLPHALLLRVDPERPPQTSALCWLANYPLVEGKAAAYVCRERACQAPVVDPEALGRSLELTGKSAT